MLVPCTVMRGLAGVGGIGILFGNVKFEMSSRCPYHRIMWEADATQTGALKTGECRHCSKSMGREATPTSAEQVPRAKPRH